MELQNQYETFRQSGAEIVSLAVASLESVEGWCQRAGIRYPVLADPEHRVAQSYGVYNLLGDGLAAPAVFVIGTDGRILWSPVSLGSGDQPDAQTILEHLPQ